MLNYFRQEVFKLKSTNYLLRTDLAELRESNKHLADHVASLEASHSALKQNIVKLNQSNVRMAQKNGEQKDEIHKLKQELRMNKLRHTSELKALQDEARNKELQQEMKTTQLRRELERLRKIVAKASAPAGIAPNAPKYERAKFSNAGRGPGMGMPRVSSMGTMSMSSAVSSEQEWGHDGFNEKSSRVPEKDDTGWCTVDSKKGRRPRKPRPPPVRTFSGHGDRGHRMNPPKAHTPRNKIVDSSLAAAALTLSPSSANSRPPSRVASPASASRRSSLSASVGKAPKRVMSQSSLALAASSKTLQQVDSTGQLNKK